MKVTDYTDKSVIHSKVNNLSIFKSILSNYMIRKIVSLDISFEQLKEIYTRDGENSLISFLSEKKDNKKPHVTNNADIIQKFIEIIKNASK